MEGDWEVELVRVTIAVWVTLASVAVGGGCAGSANGGSWSDSVAADDVVGDDADVADVFADDAAADGADAAEVADADAADPDAPEFDVADGDAADTADAAGEDAGDDAEPGDTAAPSDPRAIFGTKYWDIYRPHFLAEHYAAGRVSDRREGGVPTFGDNTVWMGYALSTFVYEYRAAGLEESLGYVHELLDGYAQLDALPADPARGYLVADPLDGYVYRSDVGPDYENNWCITVGGVCLPNLGTRDNEPSGDQMLGTLRALSDVVATPGPLVHDGVDLKALARAHAARLGAYLERVHFQMTNILGELVKRGDDQRWASWAFARAFANVTGQPQADFDATWTVIGIPVAPASQEPIGKWFIRYAIRFSSACVSGQAIDLQPLLGIPYTQTIACNEFNVGLGGDAAVSALDDDPSSPNWFSNVVDRADLIGEGNALYAMYARYRFNDLDASLHDTAARFLTAPATPPTGANLDPDGWCVPWRWAKDFSDATRCITGANPFVTFSGLDYLLPRAMSAAFHDFPPADLP